MKMPDWWVSLGEALMESELRPSELRPRSFTLTDAEREAIRFALKRLDWPLDGPQLAVVARTVGASCEVPEHRMKATLRGLLERMSGNAALSCVGQSPSTPPVDPTPDERSVPPEWTSRPYWVDPPSGWRYGFPRLYDPATDGDMTAWMIRHGYPERLARQGLACTFTACTETGGK